MGFDHLSIISITNYIVHKFVLQMALKVYIYIYTYHIINILQYLTCTPLHTLTHTWLSLHISYKWVSVAKSLSLHSLEYLVISQKYSEPRVTQLSPDNFYGRCLGAWTWRNCFTLFHDFPRKNMEVQWRSMKIITWKRLEYSLVVYLPLRKMMEFVSWDDEIPNWMESHNPFMFQTTNQICNYHPSEKYQWEGWHPIY